MARRFTIILSALILVGACGLVQAATWGPYVSLCPNPTYLGGLNTTLRVVSYIPFDNLTYDDLALYMNKGNRGYWLNTTSGTDIQGDLISWFEGFGGTVETEFTTDQASEFTLFVAGLGEPTLVSGAGYLFDAALGTLDLTAGGSGRIRIIWIYDPSEAFALPAIGLGGIILTCIGCFYGAWQVRYFKDENNIMNLGWAFLFVLIGVGLILVWLWP